jgi:hypothetical protein
VLQNLSLRQQLQADPNKDVFAVLQANDVFETGSSGLPPLLAVSLQTNGNSFFSRNSCPLALTTAMCPQLNPMRIGTG